MDKVRRENKYGLLSGVVIFVFRMTLFNFEGKILFCQGRLQMEGEFKGGRLNG